MLLDPMGPLRLDWRYIPKAMPWFIRLLGNLRQKPYARSVSGLRALNENSLAAWQRLLSSIHTDELLCKTGSLLIFEEQESVTTAQAHLKRMQEQSVAVEFWNAATVQAQAPKLNPNIKGGLFFPETGHFVDPLRVVTTLVQAAKGYGVEFLQDEVVDGQVTHGGITLKLSTTRLTASKVLLAGGAHSAKLCEALTGKSVPMDTERGYHLMLPMEKDRLPFAVTSMERRFIMTPIDGGLRLAGTVEFAGLKREANMKRAWQLHQLTKGLFKDELNAEGATPWMGFRPSLPDSLPVIDSVCADRVLLAFGHQHLGLTQAAITAELIAGLASGTRVAGMDLAPYRLSRF
jgi:D-amino-acid dehydrogenase